MFDAKAFMRAQFQPRTADVAVPGLGSFFQDGAPPIWRVRNLTGDEMAKSIDSSARQKSVDTIIKSIANHAAQINEIRAALGIGDDVSTELVKRLDHIVMASVEPVIDRTVAVKLAEHFPVEFYLITNKIVELTGLGADLKKSPGCGPTTDSATA